MANLNVPVTKSKGVVTIDTDSLPIEVYQEALLQGLKVLVNRGMSKITKAELGSEETVKAEAQVKAQKNVEDILAGKIKFTGQKSETKASGAEMTEARRIAKNMVKDAMKEAGLKISHYKASEITSAANDMIAADASILEMAKANIADRAKVPVKTDILSMLKPDAALVAKADAKKADKPLSAKQAGKVAPRAKAKPAAQPTVQ